MNKQNLVKLRDHLKTIDPDTLNMTWYSTVSDYSASTVEEANEINWCGSAACMIGHATSLFPFQEGEVHPHSGINWSKFSQRLFGLEDGSDAWEFLFEGYWPNSIEMAVKRIDYVLEHGTAPHENDWDAYGAE